MILFASTIFLSAFLLFQVQPMIAKIILPWFGGSPGVWTTCMLFFQTALVAGYAYAHLLVSRVPLRMQSIVHGILLGGALALLPIAPSDHWKPGPADDPALRILELLIVTVGAPYILLASTGPLLQGWFARLDTGRSPYRLYAISNAGSLLALISYPFVVEPLARIKTQTGFWSGGFVVFVLLCAWLASKMYRMGSDLAKTAQSVPDGTGEEETKEYSPGVKDLLSWLLLPALASIVLLAVTNMMCLDVAVIPFLWVVPLSLYLLSFIICFDHERWYVRPFFLLGMMAFIAAICVVVLNAKGLRPIGVQIGVLSGAVFFCCMVCHGEVVRIKPPPRYLTLFYLMISIGGAMGGALVAFVAPAFFRDFWEFHVSLVACCALGLVVTIRDYWSGAMETAGDTARFLSLATAIGALAALGGITANVMRNKVNSVARVRNFYGVLHVDELSSGGQNHRLSLVHGSTEHGFQFQSPKGRAVPTTYYGAASGVGLAIRDCAARHRGGGIRVGVVGLGTGTIAAYARRGDYFRYYEINPLVIRLNRQYFTYLRDARARGADIDVFPGDARIVMQNQLQAGNAQRFDILAVDAFSSDAIPIHLLTMECFHVYWDHLKPDGILAMHVTNRYLDLVPVVQALSRNAGKSAVIKVQHATQQGISENLWVLVTTNRDFLRSKVVTSSTLNVSSIHTPPTLWKDDFSAIFPILKRRQK